MSQLDHPASRYGAVYSNIRIKGDAKVHMGHVFQVQNCDLLHEFDDQDRAAIVRKALYYYAMDNRKAQIENAEPETLSWIWSTPLPDWLHGEESLFWVSGKPASGKSTLMKHLSESSLTFTYLPKTERGWLVLYFYFDFRAGTGLPNSPLGMLRSFLDQLIVKCPDVGKVLYVQQGHRLQDGFVNLYGEVESALLTALNQLEQKICLFVDGLDEYQGNLTELARVLLNLAKRSGVKLCMASRPESALSRSFRHLPTISMQQWNESVIRTYFQVVVADLLDGAELDFFRSDLLPRIISDAKGVILWARFVIDGLYDRLISGATSAELNEAFEAFPPDLEDVYRRILDKIAPRFRPQAALLLALIEAKDEFGKSPYVDVFDSEARALCLVWISGLRCIGSSVDIQGYVSIDKFVHRVHALLGGLVEFSKDRITGRLHLSVCHKTVSSFVSNREWVQNQLTAPLAQLPSAQLWGYLVNQTMLVASRSIYPYCSMSYRNKCSLSLDRNHDRVYRRERFQQAFRHTEWADTIEFMLRAGDFQSKFLRSLDFGYERSNLAKDIHVFLHCTTTQMQLSNSDFDILQSWPIDQQRLALSAKFGLARCFLTEFSGTKFCLSATQLDQMIEFVFRGFYQLSHEHVCNHNILDALLSHALTEIVDTMPSFSEAWYDLLPLNVFRLKQLPSSSGSGETHSATNLEVVCSECESNHRTVSYCKTIHRSHPSVTADDLAQQAQILLTIVDKIKNSPQRKDGKFNSRYTIEDILSDYTGFKIKVLIDAGLDLRNHDIQDLIRTLFRKHLAVVHNSQVRRFKENLNEKMARLYYARPRTAGRTEPH